jgi:hypothetical protein
MSQDPIATAVAVAKRLARRPVNVRTLAEELSMHNDDDFDCTPPNPYDRDLAVLKAAEAPLSTFERPSKPQVCAI